MKAPGSDAELTYTKGTSRMPRLSRKSLDPEEITRSSVLTLAAAGVSGAVSALLAWLLEAVPWP